MRVLITGGAGFIGSHLADRLIAGGAKVRVLDSLEAQVHPSRTRPTSPHPEAEPIVGDVREKAAVLAALEGIDAIFHLAARVGAGQRMYEIAGYTSVNTVKTAVLLEGLVDGPVKRLIVASSMAQRAAREPGVAPPQGAAYAALYKELLGTRARLSDTRHPPALAS